MCLQVAMMMNNNKEISGDSFNWSSEGYPLGQSEPYFISSPNGYISTEGKTSLTFGVLSALDDILIMVKQGQSVIQNIVGGVYYYTIPINSILFYPTLGSTEMSPPYLTKYLTDGVHTIGGYTVNGSNLISAGFNVKTFSGGISISELNSLGYISGNICKFKFYFFVGGSGLVNIDTFN